MKNDYLISENCPICDKKLSITNSKYNTIYKCNTPWKDNKYHYMLEKHPKSDYASPMKYFVYYEDIRVGKYQLTIYYQYNFTSVSLVKKIGKANSLKTIDVLEKEYNKMEEDFTLPRFFNSIDIENFLLLI